MKLKRAHVAGIVATALLFAACKKDNNDTKEPVSAQDETFIVKASQSNRAEIDLGNLALQKATDSTVKMFAQMMVDDHTTAQNDLQTVVGNLNTTANLNDSLSADQVAMHTMLQGLSGTAFDSAYIQGQLLGHQQTLNDFDTELNGGQNARVKTYAATYRPKIQSHYTLADSIATHANQ